MIITSTGVRHIYPDGGNFNVVEQGNLDLNLLKLPWERLRLVMTICKSRCYELYNEWCSGVRQ